MQKFFSLYSCCIPVQGITYSIICDIQRNEFHYIPNEFYEILILGPIEVEKLFESLQEIEIPVYLEYLEYFVELEYAFWTDTPEMFPEIEKTFDSPEKINNAIVDVNLTSDHDFKKIMNELNFLGCKFLDLRFYDYFEIDFIVNMILSYCIGSKLRGITLYLKYSNSLLSEDIYNKIIKNIPNVMTIIVHSSPFLKTESNERLLEMDRIKYVPDVISSEKNCGLILKEYFRIDYTIFFESLKFNSCLNKKISIDTQGLIKNCPSFQSNFGHHKTTSMVEVIYMPNFIEKWIISKDKVATCKTCQFRYICTDCRAYVEDFNDEFSKPLKCGYNPETNEWEDWSKLEIKQKSIDKYQLFIS